MSPQPSAYAQRKGIAAPLELDSDSDFNPGEWIDEEKLNTTKKGRKSGTKRSRLTASNSGRVVSNILVEIFGRADSDVETEREHTTANEDDITRTDDVEEDEPTSLPKTLQPFFDRRNKKYVESSEAELLTDSESENEHMATIWKRKMPPHLVTMKYPQRQKSTADESSVTESESEAEEPISTKRKSPPWPGIQPKAKRMKPVTDESSVTESESEVEIPSAKTRAITTTNAEDSVTESESESELPPRKALHPKPNFALKPGEAPKSALVLDVDKKIMVPGSINTYLRDYQRDGIRFFYKQYRDGKGGVLGDEMGLGMEAFYAWILIVISAQTGDDRDEERRRKHVSELQDSYEWKVKRKLPPADAKWPTCLIIAPSSVVPNWEREFETWGYFEVGSYVGPRAEREPFLKDFELGRLDVFITSFETARSDIELLRDLRFSCIIVDEAHRLKNVSSQTTIALNEFLCKQRFALTGTLIQNDYDEMWPLLDWCNPGAVGTLSQWKKLVSIPLKEGQSNTASEDARRKALSVRDRLVQKFMPIFSLRRTKDKTIKDQIPTKTDSVVFCPLSFAQRDVYKRILAADEVASLIRKEERCDCGSEKKRKNCCHPFDPADVLRYISVLIKLSNHLALILPSGHDNPEQLERNRQLASMAFGERAPSYAEVQIKSEYCGKWEVLHQLLTDWKRDKTSKVLIFTKSTKLLEILHFYLNAQNYEFVMLSGIVPQKARMKLIDKFQNDPKIFVFLISTLAGGTGLNLTAANKVVIFDPNWNPAHDLQAMDRAHRFGQTRDVKVYRLLGAGSIEELIYARQLYKQQQMAIGYEGSNQTRYFSGVQGDKSKQGELFGLGNLFRLHEGELATKMAIEKANLAELDWTLKNMKADTKNSSKVKRSLEKSEIETMESSLSKDDAVFKGLGALLFEDGIATPEKQTDDLLSTLYSHQNAQVLAPSRLEEERARKYKLETKKLRASKSARAPKKVIPNWPPVRKHRKTWVASSSKAKQPSMLLNEEEKKDARMAALVFLNYVEGPEDIGEFATQFNKKSEKEKKRIINELDEFVERNRL